MAKVKLTKTELKVQEDALARFNRFLPMLQLKKQQLQVEIAAIRVKVDEVDREERLLVDALTSWVGLLVDESADIPLVFDRVKTSRGNIAGVNIPVYEGVETHRSEIDLFMTPAWVDDAAEAAEKLIALTLQSKIFHEQIVLIERELRTTSQRVNLFEKIKIPECKENIRLIGISLGEEQTAAVVRGKIAKNRDKSGDLDRFEEEAVA